MNPAKWILDWKERRREAIGEVIEALGIPFWMIGFACIALLLLKDGKPMMILAREWRKERRPIRPGQPLSDWERLDEHEQSAAKWGWWLLAMLIVTTFLSTAAGE